MLKILETPGLPPPPISIILLNSLFPLVGVFFMSMSFIYVVFLFYIEIFMHAVFHGLKFKHLPIKTEENNELKYEGVMTNEERKKYVRVSTAQYYLSIFFVFIVFSLLILLTGSAGTTQKDLDKYVFDDNSRRWFIICLIAGFVSLVLHHWLFLKSDPVKRPFLEDLNRIDMYKFTFFPITIVSSFVISSLLYKSFDEKLSIEPYILTTLITALKIYFDIRDNNFLHNLKKPGSRMV